MHGRRLRHPAIAALAPAEGARPEENPDADDLPYRSPSCWPASFVLPQSQQPAPEDSPKWRRPASSCTTTLPLALVSENARSERSGVAARHDRAHQHPHCHRRRHRCLQPPPTLHPCLVLCFIDAQRSWIALVEKGLDFEIRKVRPLVTRPPRPPCQLSCSRRKAPVHQPSGGLK